MSEAVAAERRPDRTIQACLALGIMGFAGILTAAGVRLTQEDGFYYLEIARNVAAGRGSTFDGLHATNGYQPLWLAVLVPIFWCQPSTEGAMAAATLVQAALLSASTVLVFRLARASGFPAAPAAIAACTWVALTARTALSGVEFALTAMLLAAIALQLARHDGAAPSTRACALMGLLLALALLSRLDAALLVLLVAGDWGARVRGTPGAARRLAALVAPALLLGAVYALGNVILVGRPWPVSGAAKRIWSLHLLATDPVYQAHGWLAAKAWHLTWPMRHPWAAAMPSLLLGGLAACALLWCGAARRTWPALRPLGDTLRRLRPLVLFSGLQALAYALVYHGHYTYAPWYYVAQPLLAALLICAAAHALLSAAPLRLPAAVAGAAWALLLAGVAAAGGRNHGPKDEGPLYVAARWARGQLDPSARVGSWHAGAIAFLSGRDVVNLDGVVNTFDYLERDQYDLCAYWERTGITHIVDVFEAREGSVAMQGATLPVTRSYERCADRLELVWSERIPANPGWPKAFRFTSTKGPRPGP
jgi:hypothetical protein